MHTPKDTLLNSIDSLFRVYYQELCVYATQFIDKSEIIEDIVQNVFVGLISHKKQIGDIRNPRAYLYYSVRNACLRQLKQKQHLLANDMQAEQPDEHSTSIEESMIQMERKMHIYRAIDSLPTQCKKIFVLCQMEQMKYQDTADELQISVNSVKTQMKKAYRILRASLKNVYTLSFSLCISHVYFF